MQHCQHVAYEGITRDSRSALQVQNEISAKASYESDCLQFLPHVVSHLYLIMQHRWPETLTVGLVHEHDGKGRQELQQQSEAQS